jgi:hypothetical protein
MAHSYPCSHPAGGKSKEKHQVNLVYQQLPAQHSTLVLPSLQEHSTASNATSIQGATGHKGDVGGEEGVKIQDFGKCYCR